MRVYNQDTTHRVYKAKIGKENSVWNIQKKKELHACCKNNQPIRERAGTAPKKKPKKCCGCHKTKHRSDEEYKKLIHRLNRIEGQIRGIRGMVEKSAYCPDILVQVAAANAALNAFTKELLANHIKTCVADDIRAGNDEVIDELVTILQKLMR